MLFNPFKRKVKEPATEVSYISHRPINANEGPC